MAFALLQKPTKKTAQAYIWDQDLTSVYKGPYTLENAEKMVTKYKMIEILTQGPQFNAKSAEIKGPKNFVFSKDKTQLVTAPGIFVVTKFFGQVGEVVLEETNFGISPVRQVKVEKIDFNDKEQIFQLLIQAITRVALGLGDPAIRNFIVADGQVGQIDIDAEKGEMSTDFLTLLFNRLKSENKTKVLVVVSERQKEITDFIFSLDPELPGVAALKATQNQYCPELEEFTHFVLKKSQKTKQFKECENSATNSLGSYIAAFMALFNYGFYTKSEGFSITWVRTSVYTGLLEDMSIDFIVEYGPKIVSLITKLEENPTHNRAFKIAITLYQWMSAGKKSRELSFWLALIKTKEDYDAEFYNILKSVDFSGKHNLTKLGPFIDEKSKNYRQSWIYKLGQGVDKMITRCIILAVYLKHFETSPAILSDKELDPDFTRWSYLYDQEADTEIVPEVGYRKDNTGFSFGETRTLSVPLCKSVLQKAFRVGQPIDLSKIKGCLRITSRLSFVIAKHYTNDKHTKASDKTDSEDTGFIKFIRQGMRSSNAVDFYVDKKRKITLYQAAMKPYFKLWYAGDTNPSSKNF